MSALESVAYPSGQPPAAETTSQDLNFRNTAYWEFGWVADACTRRASRSPHVPLRSGPRLSAVKLPWIHEQVQVQGFNVQVFETKTQSMYSICHPSTALSRRCTRLTV